MNEKSYVIKLTGWTEYTDEIKSIRTQVFINEQLVLEELEWDGLDEDAVHVIALNHQGKVVGTARLLSTGQIGRMAVLAHERGKGIGSDMLGLLIKHAGENPVLPLFLHAQLHALKFYERNGFVRIGDTFLDANIPHCKMIRKPV